MEIFDSRGIAEGKSLDETKSAEKMAKEKVNEYSGGVEHPDRLMLNTLTGEIEQAFRRD